MINNQNTLSVLVLSVIVISLSACSGSNSSRGGYSRAQQPTFEQFDSNGDQKITLQEFTKGIPSKRAPIEDIFNRLDANNNGYIGKEEFKAIQERRGRPQ